MNEKQLMYFQKKLLAWKKELVEEGKKSLDNLKEIDLALPDPTDRASQEADANVELKMHERHSGMLKKIDVALKRIETGTYGYCEETGEPISLARLETIPTATLSVEAQEMREKRKRTGEKASLKGIDLYDD